MIPPLSHGPSPALRLLRGCAFLGALGVIALVACGPAPHAATPPPRPSATVAPPAEPPDPEPFRAQRPAPGAPGHFDYPTPKLFTLKNGVSVYSLQRPSRVVALKLVVREGAAAVLPGKSGLAALLARMLTEGTRRRSALALAEAVEGLGTTLESGASRDASEVELSVLPGDFERALELLVDVVTEPRLAEGELERVRGEWLDNLRAERQSPQQLSTLVAVRALNGPVLGAPVNGSIPDVERLTIADLRAFHAAVYTPRNTALVVVGDVDDARLHAAAERLLGGWSAPAGKPREPASFPPAPEHTRVLLVDHPDAVQSALTVLQPVPKRSEPGYEAREILLRALGGLFTSRLNTNLREKHAYTYGAFAQPIALRDFGLLLVSTSVRSDVTAPALDEVMRELERARDPALGAPISDDEIARSKADLVFSLGATLEHPDHLADTTASLFTQALPLDHHARTPALIAAVSASDVAREAARIEPKRELVVVVGDRATIEPALKQRGYAVELAPDALLE